MPHNKKPPEPMTWARASVVLALALVFDILRLALDMFWLIGPALIGVYCAAKVGGVVAVGGLLTTGCVAGAAALGFAGAGAFTMLGVVMAMAIGLFGWLTIGTILFLSNARIFKENSGNRFRFVLSLFVSEVPIINVLPAMTTILWRMYHAQIKKERADMKKWEVANAAETAAERQRTAQALQLQQAQMQEQAANDASYAAEEIPEEVRNTA